jgi:hypothetical protein
MASSNPLTPISTSSPGQLQIIRNNSNSWTIRNVDKEARFPILIGPGGTEYGSKPPPDAVDNVRRFHEGMRNVWGGLSVYGDNPGFNFGFRQPYVWISLTDSSIKKYIKKFDSQGFSPGAVVQDVERMTKMMASGKGVFFSATQFALQKQNAFNETRIWNPLTIITSSARKGAMGLMDYPQRHLEVAGGGLVNIVKSAVKSSIGINNPSKDPVPGTATDAKENGISLQANTGDGIANRGLLRYDSSSHAQTRFSAKWVGAASSDEKGGFLSSLGKALMKGLSQYIPSTKTGNADWKLRVEYSSKSNVFDTFLEDRATLLRYNVRNTKNRENVDSYITKDIHVYTPDKIYSETPGTIVSDGYDLTGMQQLLANGAFSPNVVRGKSVVNKRDDREFSTESRPSATENQIQTSNIVNRADINRWETVLNGWKLKNPQLVGPTSAETFYHKGIKPYKQLSASAKIGEEYSKTKDANDSTSLKNPGLLSAVSSQHAADSYNMLDVVSGGSTKLPSELVNPKEERQSRDTIFFYFYDLVNRKYIPFRATVTGINEVNTADWDDVQYMGRADKLYTYKGFNRDLNINFSVYANSVRELWPMWKRINYLSGLTRPSKYTDGVGTAGFMYPPLITFRIGDMFVDQPAIIRSFGLTVPDDTPWEIIRTKLSKEQTSVYSYLTGTHQEIKVGGQTTMQLPMKVDISLSMTLMEKRLCQTQDWHYFDTEIVGTTFAMSSNGSMTNKESVEIPAISAAPEIIIDYGAPVYGNKSSYLGGDSLHL